jgi:NADPH:quinone reductase-like Zn-dependent oxidoreductase
LAKLSGFSPIITTSSLKHEEWLKSQGATHVVDRNTPLTAQSVEKLASRPVLTVFDSISSEETQEQAVELLAPGGRVAVVLDVVDSVKAKAEAEKKTTVRVLGLKALTPDHEKLLREFWAGATNLLENGDLKVR